MGLLFRRVFLVYLFLLFRFPYHVLWLLLFTLALSLRTLLLLSALGPFLLYLPSGFSVFFYTVFLLGPVVAPRFFVHIDGFHVTITRFSVLCI